ncbi:MAG TPA: sulfotransferase, partial [Verrucomicrobiae bacterium]|nr:sulfotransferase [Verrucomicrobiae bacterium]
EGRRPMNGILEQARDLMARGRIGEAEALLRDGLRQAPNDARALHLLASIILRAGREVEACDLLTRAVDVEPGLQAARRDLASALVRRHDYDGAERQIDQLIANEPDNPANAAARALLLVTAGRYDEAIEVYGALTNQFPHSAALHLSHGHALKAVGRHEDAVHAYRRAIKAVATNGEGYWSLANMKTVRFTDEEIARMRALASNASLGPKDSASIHFALGKALEDRGAFDDAFAAYQKGNQIKRGTIDYDPSEFEQRIIKLEQVFTRDFFESRADWGDPTDAPIFVVGLPRTGSTLLEQILASHSQVDGTFELPFIIEMTRRIPDYPNGLLKMDRTRIAALAAEYLERAGKHRGSAPRFIDKNPNNFSHVGFIKLILPNAKIIDVRRHPMACGYSVYKQLFAGGQTYSYDLKEIGRYYRAYITRMRLWDGVLPGAVRRVVYEDVVADLETHVRAMLNYCGLPFEAACLEFHKTERLVRTPSSEQVRQPIFKAGVDQWRNFERHLEPLRAALAPVLDGADAEWRN